VIRRYVAAVLVVAIVLAGVWVTGAVITNDSAPTAATAC